MEDGTEVWYICSLPCTVIKIKIFIISKWEAETVVNSCDEGILHDKLQVA